MKQNIFLKIKLFTLVVALLFSTLLAFPVSAINVSKASTKTERSIVSEDSYIRGAYEKHFIMSDGTMMATTYAEPVYYRCDNQWVEVDNTLTLTNDVYKNINNKKFNVEFAQKAGNGNVVSISSGEYSISWTIDALEKNISANKVSDLSLKDGMVYSRKTLSTDSSIRVDNNQALRTSLTEAEQKFYAVKSESAVSYTNAFGNDSEIDLRYKVSHNKVKEDIVLNKETDLSSFVVTINTGGLKAILNDDNSISFFNKDGKTIFNMYAPYMYDTVGETLFDIDVVLEESDDGYTIEITPDFDWLTDDERVYPVVLDPTLVVGHSSTNWSDTYVHSGDTAGDHNSEVNLKVGYIDSVEHLAYVKVNTMPTIINNAEIFYAELAMSLYAGTSSGGPFSIYRVNTAWDENTITYSNKPSSVTLLESGVPCDTSYYGGYIVEFEVTSTVRSHYLGSLNNYGFMVKYDSGVTGDYNYFYSSNNTNNKGPVLTVYYNPRNESETNNLPIVADELTISDLTGHDSLVVGTLSSVNDVDYFKVQPKRHGRIMFYLVNPSGYSYDLTIYKNDANTLVNYDYSSISSYDVSYSFKATKGSASSGVCDTYYAKVSAGGSSVSTNSYRLYVFYVTDYADLGWTYPLDMDAVGITSPVGFRTVDGVSGYHTGIDIPQNENEKVYSVCSGTVLTVGNDSSMGNYIKIMSDDVDPFTGENYIITYMHFYNAPNDGENGLIESGQRISEGQKIGNVGRTGSSTGFHLHIEITDSGQKSQYVLTDYINPVDVFENSAPLVGDLY